MSHYWNSLQENPHQILHQDFSYVIGGGVLKEGCLLKNFIYISSICKFSIFPKFDRGEFRLRVVRPVDMFQILPIPFSQIKNECSLILYGRKFLQRTVYNNVPYRLSSDSGFKRNSPRNIPVSVYHVNHLQSLHIFAEEHVKKNGK